MQELHWIIDALIHWFIDSLMHWFIDSLIHWFIDLLFHWFIDSLIHWIIGSLIHCFMDSLNHWSMDALIHWFIDFIDSLIHWLIEEPFGSHLGGILGAIWEAFGSLRLRRHLGGIWTQFKQPLRSETLRGLFNLQFYEAFLRVRSQSTVNYNISWWAAAATGSSLQPRPLSNAVRTPQINLFGELHN